MPRQMSRLPNGLQMTDAQTLCLFFDGSLDGSDCAIESVRQNLKRAAAETYLSPSHPCTGNTPSIACRGALLAVSRQHYCFLPLWNSHQRDGCTAIHVYMSTHRYKGHTIALIPSMEGLMWACQYVIMKADQTEIAGFPDGNTYDDRQQAELAALAKAKSLIDESALNKDPLGSGR